jgi:hypothetical protein
MKQENSLTMENEDQSTTNNPVNAVTSKDTAVVPASFPNHMKGRIKEYASKSDDFGRKYINKVLSEEVNHKDPWRRIIDLQDRLSIFSSFPAASSFPSDAALVPSSPSLMPAVPPPFSSIFSFFSMFSLSSHDSMIYVFQELKDELLNKIQLMDEVSLQLFLKETIDFITMKDLQLIPITILRKIQKIPPLYLKKLIEKNMINVSDVM